MTTERMNYQISNSQEGLSKMNDREKQLRLNTNLTPVYTHQIINYINARVENAKVREMMIAKAKSYPHSALDNFMRRFDTILAECVSKANASKQDLEVKRQKKNTPTFDAKDLIDMQDEMQNHGEQK